MKKIIAVFLSLVLLLACAAASAEPEGKVTIGTISVNGTFSLQCGLPEGYSVMPLKVTQDQMIALISSGDPEKPVMTLSVAFDETYSDVERMNDLDDEALALLEETFLVSDPTVELSYGETGLGTRLLIARQSGEDVMNYIAFLSVYKGYFIEFVMTPASLEGDRKLTEEEMMMCIDFLTELDFIPADGDASALDIAGKTFPASITEYDEVAKTLTVTLRAPVVLDGAAVEALQVGDTFDLYGEPEEIYALDTEDGTVMVNDEYELRRQEDGSWKLYLYESECRTDLAVLRLPVPETMVFTDEIDSESLEMLDEAAVLTAADFLAALSAESDVGPGFSADNVSVTFGENGELAEIVRFYVPWQ